MARGGKRPCAGRKRGRTLREGERFFDSRYRMSGCIRLKTGERIYWYPESETTPHDRMLWAYLTREKGMTERHLPPELRNDIIAKSKTGPLGKLVVRRQTGLEPTGPWNTLKKFEENLRGETVSERREDLLEKLEAMYDSLPDDQKRLVQILRDETSPTKSIGRLMAEANVEPTKTLTIYAKGAVLLGKTKAAIAIHEGLPRIVKDLIYNHALDKTKVCSVCVGSGKVKAQQGRKGDKEECPQCDGAGEIVTISPMKEFAVKQIMAHSDIAPKGSPLVNVSQQVAVVGKGGSFMEKVLAASDSVLYPTKHEANQPDVVEAEVLDGEN